MTTAPSRISAQFANLRERGEAAFIPFLTAGDPDLETTGHALLTLDHSGADLIELGIPYSDPLADGPVIQAAATRALSRGTTLAGVLAMLRTVTPYLRAPLILFTYYNPILALGAETFLDRIREAGASGLVVPDLPLEEGGVLDRAAAERGLDLIWLVAPTSPPERVARIARAARGFISLVSTTGVTGMRDRIAQGVQTSLQQLRSLTDQPVAVGFGISNPEQAREIVALGADGAIVGSAIVRLLAETPAAERLRALDQFSRALKQAVREPRPV